jgi:hypothetical protein
MPSRMAEKEWNEMEAVPVGTEEISVSLNGLLVKLHMVYVSTMLTKKTSIKDIPLLTVIIMKGRPR